MPPSRASRAADRRLADGLRALDVEEEWKPLQCLDTILRVEDGEPVADAARRTRRRRATIERWVSMYRASGRNAFMPLAARGQRPRGATLAGMLSGRLVEEVWLRRTTPQLPSNLTVRDARDQDPDPGWDFEIESTAEAFTIDVKLHSEPFREALKFTGLESEDCVPLGLYKLLVARERQHRGRAPHVYCFAFRPNLVSELDGAIDDMLEPDHAAALTVLFRTVAERRVRQQRRAVAAVVDSHLPRLEALLDGHDFRIISTQRAVNLFLEHFDTRAPHLSGRGRSLGGTINMHLSWSHDMTRWGDVLRKASNELLNVTADFRQGRT